jgi:hypothetical protein
MKKLFAIAVAFGLALVSMLPGMAAAKIAINHNQTTRIGLNHNPTSLRA